MEFITPTAVAMVENQHIRSDEQLRFERYLGVILLALTLCITRISVPEAIAQPTLAQSTRSSSSAFQLKTETQNSALEAHSKNAIRYTRVSVASNGMQGNGSSWNAEISADGRYVVFSSDADNLVSNDNNQFRDIFLHDMQTGETIRVSIASDGSEGNSDSGGFEPTHVRTPTISSDGRFVAFQSQASNLVSGDNNNRRDIFVHDRVTHITTCVSVASDGTFGNRDSRLSIDISADGRYVAFATDADNLVISDSNQRTDVYVHDMQTRQTTRVSVATDGTQGNDTSWMPAISANGRYVAFASYADNLVGNDTNNWADVFVHDSETGETTRVSVASDGTQANSSNFDPTISGDGRYVTFHTRAHNLADDQIEGGTIVHDRQTRQTRWIDRGERPAISTSGQFVAYEKRLFPPLIIAVHDLQTGRVQVIGDFVTPESQFSWLPTISSDGRLVAFASNLDVLTGGDSNNAADIFVAELVWEELTPYECDPSSLHNISAKVREQVGPQNFCNNRFEGLSFTPASESPDGKSGFDDWAALAESAQYEVLFTNMGYDAPKGEESPGQVLAKAIANLYEKAVAGEFPQGMTVRILLGHNPIYRPPVFEDRRFVVLDDFREAVFDKGMVPETFIPGKWQLEVANYNRPSTSTYSHAKFMVVDGRTVLAAGFNMEKHHLKETVDFGIQVTGPIAQAALEAFDRLWVGSKVKACEQLGSPIWKTNCPDYEAEGDHLSTVQAIKVTDADISAFSLFRTDQLSEKEADNAVKAALMEAVTSIDVMQVSFTPERNYIVTCPDPDDYNFDELAPAYMQGLVEAIKRNHSNGNSNFEVRILLSGKLPWEKLANLCGIKLFQHRLEHDELGNLWGYVKIKNFKRPSHAKVVVIDRQFLIVGSHNWSFSGFGDDDANTDLAEYSLGIDDQSAAQEFLKKFDSFWGGERGDYTPVAANDDVKAVIENASSGAVVALYGDSYQLSSPIEVNNDIQIIALGTKLSPVTTTVFDSTGQQPLLRINSSNVEIIGLVLSGASGHAIEIGDGPGTPLENISIASSVFENNALGGIRINSPSGGAPISYTLENNTFVGSASGVSIDVTGQQADTASIRHNIFAGQSVAPIEIVSEADGNVEYSYNLFYDCGSGGNCASNWHIGNLSIGSSAHDNLFDLDPMFANSDAGDYRLSAGSPAIDAGNPEIFNVFIFDGDGDGIPRIDIGAFEYVPDSLFSSVGEKDDKPNIPVNYSLSQNYPNPFNPVTHIRFGLPKASQVKIELYNTLGQRVTTLFDGWKPAGDHVVTFDTGELASAVYFYRFEADGFSQVKKMLLMK